MSQRQISLRLISLALPVALVVSGTGIAQATPADPAGVAVSITPGVATAPGVIDQGRSPQLIEPQGKFTDAIKAAFEALKRVNKGWYDSIVSQASKGKDAFMKWWDGSVPNWIKVLFGNIAASAVWEFITTYII